MKNLLSFFQKKSFCLFWMMAALSILSSCGMDVEVDIVKAQENMNSTKSCWTCQIFTIVFNTGAVIATNAYDAMKNLAWGLLAVGLVIYLCLRTLSLFLSMRVPNLPEYWISITTKLGKGGLVSIFLLSSNYMLELINTIIAPIITIFVRLSFMILNLNFPTRVLTSTTVGSTFTSGPGLPAEIGSQLEDLVYRATVALNIGRALGIRLMTITDFTGFIVGLIITGIFFMLLLFFPMYLIDAFVRIIFFIILLPILLVAWVFSVTEKYFKAAWNMFIGGLAQLLITCVFVALLVSTVEAFTQMRGYNIILNPTYQNTNPDVLREMCRMSVSALSFVVMAFYLYNLSKHLTEISGFLTNSSPKSMVGDFVRRLKQLATAVAMAAVAAAAAAAGAAPVAAVMKRRAIQQATKATQQDKNGGG